MTAGLIVAGGRSSRFGETDKALAKLAGRPLIAHVVSGLEGSLDQLLVSCRREQREAIELALSEVSVPLSFVLDERELGPLGGVCDGLKASDSEWTLVVGCDFPFVDGRVAAALSPANAVNAVIFQYPDGTIQPLCGRYRTDPACAVSQRLLSAGEYRVQQLVSSLSTQFVPVSDSGLAPRLENINTPTALADAETRLLESERS